VTRELARGGQVFYVVPRILGIEEHAVRIRELVPHARVLVAHGQIPDEMLERTMVDFVEHRADVLVSTAIIESGLDIPRANTMFIAHAEQFGLAQLYQLRGRVGRAKQRAHCYLMVQALERLSPDARRRLEAVQRHSELGSGFGVAVHDLEIRGAGELLGARQSGQIQAIGFDAYARILQEAVSSCAASRSCARRIRRWCSTRRRTCRRRTSARSGSGSTFIEGCRRRRTATRSTR
jgi:transcription-repair coupling factor (superfamily II helicase)